MRVERWLVDHAPEVVQDLREPATESALYEVLGHPLATASANAICEVLELHDGQRERYRHSAFPGGICLSSASDIVSALDSQLEQETTVGAWRDWTWQDVESARSENRIVCSGEIDPRFSARWLPFASLNGGDLQLMIDDTGKGDGTPGQIILADMECAEFHWVGKTLQSFLAEYADALEIGSYVVGQGDIEPDRGDGSTRFLFSPLRSVQRFAPWPDAGAVEQSGED